MNFSPSITLITLFPILAGLLIPFFLMIKEEEYVGMH